MARITSISGRQCPAGCDDEEDLARAPNIFVIGMPRPKDRITVDALHLEDEVGKCMFGLVIGESRHRPTADVLHLTDEAAKREDRERRNNMHPETWPRHRNTSSAESREDELIEFKRFREQLSKRSVNHQRFPRRFQPPQRRASPAVGGDKNDFNHHEEM